MEVLVVGAGIAGPTLAYWLMRAGHRPTLVEQAPALRTGGHLVDFWGAGFDVAERMGVAPELVRRGYHFTEARAVAADGRRIGSFRPSAFLGSSSRYVSIARSELAAVLYDALDGRVETVLGDTVEALDDDGERVRVTLRSGNVRDVDLVVGADGLHSQVRRLVFGAQERFERYLGIVVAALEIDGYRPRDELVALMHAGIGYQVVRVSLEEDTTLVLLTVRHPGAPVSGPEQQQALLRERLAGAGWEIPAVLDALPRARTFYFDRVSQIRMPSWTRGRVALVGDAAACPSLLAGQGSALAMVGSYVLAAELARSDGDHAAAFARYEARLRPLLRAKQDGAVGLGLAFAPRSRFQLLVRNAVMRVMGLPFVANLAMGRSFRDAVELPPIPVV
ncbi:MAG: FAD-binding domain [Pseudonocardia sp.]